MEEIFKSEVGKQEILGKYREILASWPVQNQQYEIETSFGSTFVIESGSSCNPPLILLHGSVSNSFTWYGDVVSLSKTHHVYAIDIIGEAGLSASSRPSYESGAYPQWLNEVLQALRLNTCSIVGLSLGGWMALSFATTYPDKVDKLILLCPGGLAREKASFIWKVLLFSLLGKWGNHQILKLINGGKALSASTPGLEKGLAFTGLISKHFRPRMGKLPIFSDQLLSRLTMPVQVLFGEFDYLLSANESIERLKRLVPQAETELLPDTGHAVVNQAERILKFLERRSQTSVHPV